MLSSGRLLIWQMNSHASPTGVAFQSLLLKAHCAGEWGRRKACCQEHARTRTRKHTTSLFHMAPWRLRSVLSQGKIRECGKAWETTEECAFLCTLLNWPEDNYGGHRLSPQQGGPCVRGAQLIAQSPNWAFEGEFTHQPTVGSRSQPARGRRGLCWHVIIPQLMWGSGRDSGGTAAKYAA